MPKVFISYRRNDSQYQADRLHDALTRVIPKKDVFIDIDDIPAGVDFVQYLDETVAQCSVLLALIGPQWLSAAGENGRRLDDPKDFVRIEIASALRRGIPVAPVLLDGAPMPREDQLPDELKPLVRRNGVEVRRNNFAADTQRLIDRLELGPRRGTSWRLLSGVCAALVLAGLVGWFAYSSLAQRTPPRIDVTSSAVTPTQAAPSSTPSGLVAPATEAPTKDQVTSLAASGAHQLPSSPAPQLLQKAAAACEECPQLKTFKLKDGGVIIVSPLVSDQQWAEFCRLSQCPERDDAVELNAPKTAVSWTAVMRYVEWLNLRSGRKYRLPTAQELDELQEQAPHSGISEWSGTCREGAAGSDCAYEVRGISPNGRRIADWYSVDSKGKSLGFRVVLER